MPYGEIRVDTITFTNAGVDKSITVSGLFASTSGNLTVTGTVSGTTFTGTTANFTSGNVTTFSGGTCTITSGVFASGTATNPSISFIADSNTGLYSPGADQIAITTNGAGRLFVNSSGSVGIGTSSPSAPFHVAGSARIGANDTSTVELSIGEGATGDRIALLDFVGDTTYSDYGLRFIRAAGANGTSQLVHRGTGDFAFITNEGSPLIFYTTNSERLRIDSAGRVGIGTSSANYKLDVSGGTLTPGHFSSAVDWNFSNLILRRNVSNISTAKMLSMMLQGDTDSDTTLTNYLNIWGTYSAAPTTGSTTTGLSGAMNLGAPYAILWHVNGSERVRIENSGNVGIGTSSPGYSLDVVSADTTASVGYAVRLRANATAGAAALQFTDNGATAQYGYIACDSSLNLKFTTGTTERARIDESGRLLVGISTAVTTLSSIGAAFQVNEGSGVAASLLRSTNDSAGANLVFRKTRSTTPTGVTIVQNNDYLGAISWMGTDGSNPIQAASISAQVDGTPGTNDMPCRLIFATAGDGEGTPTERVRITSGGYFKASNSGGYSDGTGNVHEFATNNASNASTWFTHSNASYAGLGLLVDAHRAASTSFSFLNSRSNTGSSADIEFNLRGDGNAFADGSWSGGGADYAEYFEWSDGNLDAEDRRGIAVVLDGEKIRPALAGEDPIGVISGNPSVVGDSAWNKWSGKYLRDDYGTYIFEDYEVTDEEGSTVVQQRRKLNPAYDPDVEYTSREERPEWDCVGLMGKLRIRKGQPTGSRWIKMRDISDSVEEWLVR
jgi:hypothetical protein